MHISGTSMFQMCVCLFCKEKKIIIKPRADNEGVQVSTEEEQKIQQNQQKGFKESQHNETIYISFFLVFSQFVFFFCHAVF